MTALAPLLAWRQWIVVRLVPLPTGKTDKLPVDPATGHVTGPNSGGALNPAVWLDHDTARALAIAYGPNHTVGFVLTENDPFFCLDIDDALQPDGTWSPTARSVCNALPGCAIEVSQSGRGLHVWGQGPVPPHAKKNIPLKLELYDSLRFIAIGQPGATGDMTQPCAAIATVAANLFPVRALASGSTAEEGPCPEWRGPVDDDELLRRAMRSSSASSVFGGRASFADLWSRNVDVLGRAYPADSGSSEPYDGSSADMALASHLAFWTGRDVARIERLMRRSALAREKWDTRDDYLVERTIRGACSMCQDVLQDKPVEPPPSAALVPTSGTGVPASGTATALTPAMRVVEGSTFLAPADQATMFAGCVYVRAQHKVWTPTHGMLAPDRFNATFGGYSFVLDGQNTKTTRKAFEAFTESQVLRAPQAHNTCFRPAQPSGALVEINGRVFVNAWVPPNVRRVPGDVEPFLSHMRKLFPTERDRTVVLSGMAAIVQYPGRKFPWALLLQGVEGNGKTLLSAFVAYAVGGDGEDYVAWPKASRIIKQFNGWIVNTVFAAIEDIYTPDGRDDIIEELKPLITGARIEVEFKGQDQFTSDSVVNFILNSNHKAALKKTRNDRRFCPVFCAQQTVDDLVRDGMGSDYMRRMWDYYHGDGKAFVAHYLMTFAIPEEFDPTRGAQRAPLTSSTDEAIRASLGFVEQSVIEAVEQDETGFRGGWISSKFLGDLLKRINRAAAMPPNKWGAMLRELGYVPHPALHDGRLNNVAIPDGIKSRLWIKAGSTDAALTTAAAVREAYMKAQASQ